MNLWYNNKTNELTTMAPWGERWVAAELIEAIYGDWEQVPEDFIPPAPVKTKAQLIAELNAEVESQFKENDVAYLVALRFNNSDLMQELQTEREALTSEYNARMEEISDGE